MTETPGTPPEISEVHDGAQESDASGEDRAAAPPTDAELLQHLGASVLLCWSELSERQKGSAQRTGGAECEPLIIAAAHRQAFAPTSVKTSTPPPVQFHATRLV